MPVEKKTPVRRIPVILVSGFLGSGKTTFLNNLFGSLPGFKFGIIINDFGGLNVDSELIKKTEDSVITELNNGQIFCSCLSGSFVKSVSTYVETDIDYLLVETSGLAKPSPLLEIVEAIKKINGEKFAYHGMISIVDCSNYLQLSSVLKAVDEQISYSDIVLLNKTDTVDDGIVAETEAKIISVKPDAEVIRTRYGVISAGVFLGLEEKAEIRGPDSRYAGWGEPGRPVPLVLRNDGPVRMNELESFIDYAANDAFRIKGLLNTDEGKVFVDTSVGSSSLKKLTGTAGREEGLVIILPAEDDVVEGVKERASEIFSSVI